MNWNHFVHQSALKFTSFHQMKTHKPIIFTEFYFIMLQTMTSRYIDTQLLLCVYVHLWVYVCVKRAVRPQKAEWKNPAWGSPRWVNKAMAASEEGTGRFSGPTYTHTHTNRVKRWAHVLHVCKTHFCCGSCVYALSSLGGSLRSCECLLESIVKRDEAVWKNETQWVRSFASSLSPDRQSKRRQRDSPVRIYKHTRTHTRYTHMYTWTRQQNPVWFHCRAAFCSISATIKHLLDSFRSFFFLAPLFHHHSRSDRTEPGYPRWGARPVL